MVAGSLQSWSRWHCTAANFEPATVAGLDIMDDRKPAELAVYAEAETRTWVVEVALCYEVRVQHCSYTENDHDSAVSEENH
jgi:hypothetical protein